MRNWRLCIVLFVSLISIIRLPQPQVRGCTFSPYEVIRAQEFAPSHISFFPSNAGGDPRLVRYAFVTHPESLQGSFDGIDNNAKQTQPGLKETNLQEWRAFFRNQVLLEAVDDLVYHSKLLLLEHARHRIAQGTPLPKQSNALLLQIQATKNLPALDYLIFAKRCEPFAVYEGDPWSFADTIEKQRDPKKMKLLMDQGLKLYAQTASPFLKMRYGYQIVRLAHYSRRYSECIRAYDTLIAGLNINSVYRYQAMRHKAAALKKMGRRSEALVLTSLIFDQSNPLMNEAYQESFTPTPKEWEEALLFNSNPHRQATLWLLRSLRERERINLEPIQALYRLEPKSPRLETLLIRQINIIEKNLVDTSLFDSRAALGMDKAAYIRDFLAFLQGADKIRVRQPALWYMAEGYLQLLLKNHRSATIAIEQGQNLTDSDTLTALATDLKNLSALMQARKITPHLENALLPTLKRYDSMDGQFNHAVIGRSFLLAMAQKYFKNQQFVKGYGCINRTGYANLAESLITQSASPENLDELLAFMAKMPQTPFDAWIKERPLYLADDVLAVRGTQLIHEERFREALERLSKVSPDYWRSPLYPIATSFERSRYNARTGLYNYPEDGFRQFSKAAFMNRVVSLLDLAVKQPQAADQCYYQIANGFFHSAGWSYYDLTYRGVWFEPADHNPRFPFDDEKQNHDLRTASSFNPPWVQRRIAWKYYEKARAVTKNKELATECAFMAAACQTTFARQKAYVPEGRGRSYYYKLLQTDYAETDYYRNVVKECSSFLDYLKNQ